MFETEDSACEIDSHCILQGTFKLWSYIEIGSKHWANNHAGKHMVSLNIVAYSF